MDVYDKDGNLVLQVLQAGVTPEIPKHELLEFSNGDPGGAWQAVKPFLTWLAYIVGSAVACSVIAYFFG